MNRLIMLRRSNFLAAAIVALLFLCSGHPASALTYYSRTNGGLWTNPTTWSTVTYGNATNTGTFPGAGDNVFIGDGYTIYFNTNGGCNNITIGQGASGALEFYNLAIYWMTVTGDITINAGGRFAYGYNSSRAHILYIEGDITNNGTVDLYLDANDNVALVAQGNTNSVISGTGSWDLYTVLMSKITSRSNYLEVQSSAFETAMRGLTLNYGTYVHNNSGTYTFGSGSDYTIPPNVAIDGRSGTLNFSSGATNLNLQGALIVSGGTVYIASSTGTGGIRTDQGVAGVVPYLQVSAGQLVVYGSISFRTAPSSSFAEPFSYNQSGGTVLVNSGSTGVTSEVFYVTDQATSSFVMSGGTLNLQRPNRTGSSVVDMFICGNSGTVNSTGGIVQFGNASTPVGSTFNFRPFPNATYPAFRITGPSGSGNSLRTSNASTSNFRLLAMVIDAGTTFDIRSIAGTAGNSKRMSLRGTFDGNSAWYNDGTFNPRSGEVAFEGTAAQTLDGSTDTWFYNMTMNNAAGLTMNARAFVDNSLNMTNGIIYTDYTNLLSVSSSGNTTIGTSSSYIIGPFNQIYAQTSAATGYFPLGKGANWRPMTLTPSHTTSDSVNYVGEMIESPASGLPYTLPGSLSAVSARRYWLVTNTNTGIFNNATARLYYGTDDGVTDRLSLRVGQAISPNWVNRGGTGTANGTGNITSSSFNAWGAIYTLANATGGSNALPIELVSFVAESREKDVELRWTTATEINNDFFTVERSRDGLHFEAVAQTAGAGNTTTLQHYKAYDLAPLNGTSFYRLRQTDFDGRSTTSDVVTVYRKGNTDFSVYPNPIDADDDVMIRLPHDTNRNLLIQIKRSDGSLAFERTYPVWNEQTIRLSALPLEASGLYVLSVFTDDGGAYQQKLMANIR